jgi:hypothetical protein
VTDFVGSVINIRTPYDVNGIYAAAGAGAAVGVGGGALVLTNQNGAVLTLSGFQAGLIVAADLNGLVISVRKAIERQFAQHRNFWVEAPCISL